MHDRRNWAHLSGEIVSSWEWVVERVTSHLSWVGDFSQPDADAIRQPPGFGAFTPGYGSAPMTGQGWAPAAREEYSTLAIVAFVLALVVSLGLPSVILGHMAISEIRRTGKRGHGLAVAAVVLGYVELAFILVILLFFVGAVVATR